MVILKASNEAMDEPMDMVMNEGKCIHKANRTVCDFDLLLA